MRYLTALFPLLLLALNACGAGEVAIRPSVFPSQFAPGQIRERLSNLKLINYYPVGNAQTNVWLNWQPEVIDSDMARIAAMNANAVRIAVFPAVFGYPNPRAEMRARLAQFIALAAQHGLQVELVLFGFWSDYADVDRSATWAREILTPYKNDSRLAFVELQNELPVSNPRAVVWAKQIIPHVLDTLAAIPLTISISGSAGVRGLEELKAAKLALDFYELHYYGHPALAFSTFQSARRAVGDAPLFIGETGYSTEPRNSDGAVYTSDWWEAYQDQYYRTVEAAARAAGLPFAAPWTMSDFSARAFPPNSRPALSLSEYQYGLYRTDGTPKRAASSIAAMFASNSIDTSFNNSFEQNALGLPTHWLRWQAEDAAFARDAQVSHSGKASARITASTANKVGLPAFYLSPVQPIAPGQTATATVWARGQRSTGITRLTLAWFDARQKYIGANSSANLSSGTTAWTQLRVRAVVPLNAAYVEIHLVSANNRGTAWFDDVTFEAK